MEYILFFLEFINLKIENNFYFSIFIYFIFLLFFFSFSFPGGSILILSSGFFFGLTIGFLINLISMLIGSFIFFIISRFLFQSLLKKYHDKYSVKLNTIIKKSSYEYLILLRMILGPPLFVQNLCLSILNIPKTKFLISSAIGFTPLLLLFTYTGNQLSNLIQIKYFKIADLFNIEILLVFILLFFIIIIRIFFKNK